MQSFFRRVAVGGGLIALLFLFGCVRESIGILGGGGGGGGKTCTLKTESNTENVPLTVRYSASLSGKVQIRVLTYQTNLGAQSVTDLKNSWSKTVNVDGGVQVGMSATVKVFNGEAKISYTGRDSTGTRVVSERDLCSAN